MSETKGVRMEERNSEDLELVKKAQKGDLNAQEALILRYSWIARSKARNYFLEGGSRDDLVQEGMIGIWKAIRDFDINKNDNFIAFMNMCVSSQIKDALRTHNRAKNKVLNDAVSLNAFDENISPEYVGDPIGNYIEKEGIDGFYEKLATICTKEQTDVLKYYFEGYTYSEIASIMELPVKKIDNIIFSVKTKIKKNKELFLQ